MFFPSEWSPQECVQLTWPHAGTDWAQTLDEVTGCYLRMAREIAAREPLLIVAQSAGEVERLVRGMDNVRVVECPTNDTWARDHAFISCVENGERQLLDFQFNGWGMKFAANRDNLINRHLRDAGVLKGAYVNHLDFVLEGGSVESDGRGTILTTASCLLAPNRNEPLGRKEIERRLCRYLGAERVLWLSHGRLAGDDTDGHIDTLARLCPNDTIAHAACADTDDEHHAGLAEMEEELRAFRTPGGRPYQLVPLPLPRAIHADGERLPATYANYLVLNGAVLCPTYGQPDRDAVAMERLQGVFPDREIVGIDCRPLIRQHGSLHCCTMQYPAV